MHISFRALGTATLGLSILVLAGCGGAEARKQSYLERGDKYYAEQNYDKARVEYRNAMQIDPKDAQAHFSMGRTAEKLENPKEAVGQYQATIDLNPKHSDARAALARLYLFGGLPDKAMELAEAGLQDDPNHADLLTVRGAVLARKGNVVAAFEDAEAAFKIAPDNEYTIALLASLYRQNARSDKAVEVIAAGLARQPNNLSLHEVMAELQFGLKNFPEAENHLKAMVALAPKNSTYRARLARFYVVTKDLDSAESVLRAGVEADPKNMEAKFALVNFLTANRGAEAGEKQLHVFVDASPDDMTLKLHLGSYYQQLQQLDMAEKVYREVLATSDRKPDGLMARNRLAALYLQRNDIKQATPLVDEVLKESARDNDALIMRANIALARGDTAVAITDLRSVLRDQPNSIPVMRALARAHLQNKELSLAEETLRNAVQLNPKDPDARLDLAQVLAQQGKPDQARPILEQLNVEAPNNLGVQETLFRAQAATKDLVAARNTADALAQAHPELALGHFLVGAVDEASGKMDSAISHYERALKAQPMAAEPLTALVRIEMARKKPQAAMALLDRAIAAGKEKGKGNENVVAYNLRGDMLISDGRYADAIAAYETAIQNGPQWWVPYRGLAVANLATKNSDGAIAAFRRGLENIKNEPALLNELASLYERLGRVDDAIKVYEDWLLHDANSIVASNNLAMILVNYKKDPQSLDRAKVLAVKLSASDEPAVLDTRGWIDYKSGNYRQAVELLERAVEKSASSAVLKYHLGMAQLASGDQQEARRNLEAALSGNSAFRGSDEAKSALDELKKTS